MTRPTTADEILLSYRVSYALLLSTLYRNMYYGNMTAAKRTVDHVLSYMRSSPTWIYNGGARSWGES